MTTLCIDELSSRLKQRWGWNTAATHIPADAECPLLVAAPGDSAPLRRARAVLPAWLEPQRGFDRPPGLAAFHGKTLPSMG